MNRSQSVVGTPYWMAPEVLNSKSYDEKADVFSYGTVVSEVISRLDADPDEISRMIMARELVEKPLYRLKLTNLFIGKPLTTSFQFTIHNILSPHPPHKILPLMKRIL